jgi:hypothetical protein
MSELFIGGRDLGAGIYDADLKDAALVDLIAAYRRRVAGNYRPLRPDDIETLPPGRMLVSTKIDGELWFLVRLRQQSLLINPRGKVITGDIPVLQQAEGLSDGVVIAGELHAITEGRRARVGDLAATLAGGKQAAVDLIRFTAFDLLRDSHSGGETLGYDARHARITQILKGGKHLQVLQFETFNTAAQVRALFEKSVAPGEIEGLVIRLDSGLIYKLKPEISIDAAIIAYTTKADQPNLTRSVLLGLMREDESFYILGGCGNLGSDDDRRSLLARLVPLKAASEVRYASDGGGLYTFVKPELVAEIKMTDLQAERSDGSASQSMLIRYQDAGWQGLGLRVCPRPLHPVLERLRADKSVTPLDIRFSQVEAYLHGVLTKGNAAESLPASELLRREVWTRNAKGLTSVRKLLVWKTNKVNSESNYPAYVVHWTDYSPGRATPLDREVRLAPAEHLAMAIADAMVAENIKKGWERI